MGTNSEFVYKPDEHELEKASNSYLMSLIAIIAGFPLPIINLIAISIFYLGNRKSTLFVKWHCTQTLLSHITILAINSYGYYWALTILFGSETISNRFIAYIIVMVVYNISEFIVTIYTAVNVRKGKHVQWWVFGALANVLYLEK